MRLWEKSAPSLDCSCIQVRHWCASCQKKALQLCTPFFVRFYCRCGLHSRERMGFIAFQIKAARQVTCVCVHTQCVHVLGLQHLLCASAGLRNECVHVLPQERCVGVLYLLEKESYPLHC